MNKKLNSFAIFVASVIVSLILVEIGLRAIYYQLNAPYALGIHHLLVTRVIPLLRSGAVGLELNRRSWEATYQERLMPIPPRGPREGYWGTRIAPKNYDNCAYLRYCEARRHVAGLIDIDAAGIQHVGPHDGADVRILIIGGSVAFGAYASAIEKTYFVLLHEMLLGESIKADISVLAAGGWLTGDEVAAFADRGLELRPDVVIFLNGLNDLLVNEDAVAGYDHRQRSHYYLRNMQTAGALAAANGIKAVYVLQPSLRDKQKKSSLEEQIVEATFGGGPHPDFGLILAGLRRLASTDRLYYVDLSHIMDDETVTTFADAFHFSDPGHELLAAAMTRSLLPILRDRPRRETSGVANEWRVRSGSESKPRTAMESVSSPDR